MQIRGEDTVAHHHSIDEGLEQLRRDPPEPAGAARADAHTAAAGSQIPLIDFAVLELEVERMRRRLLIWDIFLRYMRDGARTWDEVQRAMTPDDLDDITAICDGAPLRDVLMDLG